MSHLPGPIESLIADTGIYLEGSLVSFRSLWQLVKSMKTTRNLWIDFSAALSQ